MQKRKRITTDAVHSRLMDVEETMKYCSLGRAGVMKLGNEANAIIRIGRRVLFDRQRIDAAIEKQLEA